MFAKLKEWAAALWLAMRVELYGGREAELIDQLVDALNRERSELKNEAWKSKQEVEQVQSQLRLMSESRDEWTKVAGDRLQEIERLKASRKGLEEDAAILVNRQKEDAAKIEELAASVQFYGDRAKTVEKDREFIKQELEARLKHANEQLKSANQSVDVLRNERDKHMRAAAEWQGQCKRMTLELEASRVIIAGTKLAEGELLIVQGNMDGLIKLRQYMAGIPLTKCVFISDKMAAWKATPISTGGNTSATWPNTGEFTDPQPPLKEPEIESIGDVPKSMNKPECRSHLVDSVNRVCLKCGMRKVEIDAQAAVAKGVWESLSPDKVPVIIPNIDRPEVATIEDGLGCHRAGGVAFADGPSPRTIAEVMKDPNATGVEITMSGNGDAVTTGNSLDGSPLLTCPNCNARVGTYSTKYETGVSRCWKCDGEQLAEEARRYQEAAKLWPNGKG